MNGVEKLLREQLKEELPGGTFDMFVQFLKSKISTNYSQDETTIGTWIDGKPIYRKSYFDLDIVDGSLGFDVNELNIDTCIDLDAILSDNEGFRYFKSNNNPPSIGLQGSVLDINQDTLFYSKEDGYINFSGYRILINLLNVTQDIQYRQDIAKATIHITYTKTTDSNSL